MTIATAWDTIVSAIWDFEHEDNSEAIKQMKKTASSLKIPLKWFKLARSEESASSALMTFFGFESGPNVATDGMSQVEGYALYLKDPTKVGELGTKLCKLAESLT